jgi:dTDP-glucose 4,6-dehydratase
MARSYTKRHTSPILRFFTLVFTCSMISEVKDEDGQIDISWINEDLITFVKDRLGHDQRYAIDPAKITAALGWYPETKFEDGIVKTIEWYLNNQDWVEEVTSGDYQHYYEKMYGKR